MGPKFTIGEINVICRDAKNHSGSIGMSWASRSSNGRGMRIACPRGGEPSCFCRWRKRQGRRTLIARSRAYRSI